MLFFSKHFLEASVGQYIWELCIDCIKIKTDPVWNDKGPKDLENSVRLLSFWCSKFSSQIYNAWEKCSPCMGYITHISSPHTMCLHYPASSTSSFNASENWLNCDLLPICPTHGGSVSAFCFLWLIVLAILHPHLFGLHPGLHLSYQALPLLIVIQLPGFPSPGFQHSLTLIVQAIQSLENLSISFMQMPLHPLTCAMYK